MEITNLIDTIFESDYVPFVDEYNQLNIFEGFFYICNIFEVNNSIQLLCRCLNHGNFFLDYKDFNYYVIHGRIIYYSNINYIDKNNFLYKYIFKKRKISH